MGGRQRADDGPRRLRSAVRFAVISICAAVAACSSDSVDAKESSGLAESVAGAEARRVEAAPVPRCDIGEPTPLTHPAAREVPGYPWVQLEASEHRAAIEAVLPGWFCDLRNEAALRSAVFPWSCRLEFGRSPPDAALLQAAQQRLIEALGVFPLQHLADDDPLRAAAGEDDDPVWTSIRAIHLWNLDFDDDRGGVATMKIPRVLAGALVRPDSILSIDDLNRRWSQSAGKLEVTVTRGQPACDPEPCDGPWACEDSCEGHRALLEQIECVEPTTPQWSVQVTGGRLLAFANAVPPGVGLGDLAIRTSRPLCIDLVTGETLSATVRDQCFR